MRLRSFFSRLPVGLLRFIKFNTVGVLNTAVDFAVFTLLIHAGLFYLASQICSYICGLINSYFLNRFWTFGYKGRFNITQALMFVLVNLVSLGTALGCLYLFRDVFEIPLLLSKIIATVGSVTVNFAGNKLLVFKTVD